MKIKVLQVIDTLSIGGAEKVAVDLTNLLYDSSIDVKIVILVNKGYFYRNINSGVKIYFLRRRRKWSFWKMFQFSRIARKFDLLHVHLRHNLKYVYLCKMLFPFKASIVFHDHFGDININTSFNLILSHVLKQVFYVGPSKQICRWAEEEIGIEKNKIYFLPNIILKGENRINKNPRKNDHLLLISNFRRTKNILFAVELINHLHNNGRYFAMDIIGQPIDKDYVVEVKELIKRFDLTDSIHIIHNCTKTNEIMDKYALAIHPSFSETGPLVLLEYLSQELPFLSFNTGEVINIVKKNFPEFVIDCHDVIAWETKIEKILNLDYKMLKEKMNILFNENCSKDKYAKQILAFYDSAINSN